MSLPPTRLFTPSCPKTSPPSNRPTLPTLQTRDAFLATDALINARKNGYRPLAVASTSNGVELRFIEKACYFTHIDGTMPFRMIDGRQVIESLGPPTTTYCPTRISPHNLYKPHNCHRGYKELMFKRKSDNEVASPPPKRTRAASHFLLAAARPQTLGTRFRGRLSDFWSM
ncbi:BZ3500_MvSof-1268-A1-R1_Chr4-2g06883 [Microbotryum saponariae]|uniref:BZ3500_MvSof-1268-A1-R1_Chr4-2g06883 protein n=1 Tax=Microbotryum saponariae TaxID=289078 RepID=A0A2X0KWZ1_9BASI|nr:BZ3500_MvSof-1268-A1-R1_Chr4-2g06883 [Microbotryum saponariae]SDA06548.1 BZ3501_MvSof-1269-A2-R1_Chr4-2g06594 [Microbotryum saponariae]